MWGIARRYLESLPPDHAVVKLDFANTFNMLYHYDMRQAIHDRLHDLYPSSVFQFTGNLYFCTTEMTLFKKEPSWVILLDQCFYKYCSPSAKPSFIPICNWDIWMICNCLCKCRCKVGRHSQDHEIRTLEDQYIFQPAAVESLCPMNCDACKFLADLGGFLTCLEMTGKPLFCSNAFLFCFLVQFCFVAQQFWVGQLPAALAFPFFLSFSIFFLTLVFMRVNNNNNN